MTNAALGLKSQSWQSGHPQLFLVSPEATNSSKRARSSTSSPTTSSTTALFPGSFNCALRGMRPTSVPSRSRRTPVFSASMVSVMAFLKSGMRIRPVNRVGDSERDLV
jgi:hypothetical protein